METGIWIDMAVTSRWAVDMTGMPDMGDTRREAGNAGRCEMEKKR